MARFDTLQAPALDAELDQRETVRMTRTFTLLGLAAAAALAGCNNQDQTAAGSDGDETNAAANAPIELPPAIVASKTYRCKDNSLVYIDWLSDGTARVKKTQTEVGTPVTPGDAGPLKGDPQAASVTYNGQSCKA